MKPGKDTKKFGLERAEQDRVRGGAGADGSAWSSTRAVPVVFAVSVTSTVELPEARVARRAGSWESRGGERCRGRQRRRRGREQRRG